MEDEMHVAAIVAAPYHRPAISLIPRNISPAGRSSRREAERRRKSGLFNVSRCCAFQQKHNDTEGRRAREGVEGRGSGNRKVVPWRPVDTI